MDEQRQKKPLHQVHACQRYPGDKLMLVGSYIYASVQTGLELATSRIRAPILTQCLESKKGALSSASR